MILTEEEEYCVYKAQRYETARALELRRREVIDSLLDATVSDEIAKLHGIEYLEALAKINAYRNALLEYGRVSFESKLEEAEEIISIAEKLAEMFN